MTKLVWDATSERLYETGVEKGVIYPQGNDGAYQDGAAWNGLISVTESPSGAEASPLYANNKKYLELFSKEEFGGSIEAYTYPDEFGACIGEVEVAPGVSVAQQTRIPFGLSYKTLLGNDTEGDKHGYKLHIVYGARAAVSEKAYTSVNDSPEAITFSWEFTTTPVEIEGFEPSAHIEITSTKVDADKLAELEAILYGSDAEGGANARLPLPDEIAELFKTAA